MLAFWLVCVYIGVFYVREFLSRRKSPPGPWPIPIIGNLPHLAKASDVPNLAIAKFGKEYGEVFQLHMGTKTLVVPSTTEAIEAIFSHPDSNGRDCTGSWSDRNFGKNLGLVFSDGLIWEKTKMWTIKNLRDYGFGKSASMESSIKDELDHLFRVIEENRVSNNNVVKVTDMFTVPVFYVMWQMVVGHRTKEDEEIIANLLEKSEAAIRKGVFGAGLVNAFPIMRFIIPESTGHAAQMIFYKDAHQAAKGLLHNAKLEMESRHAEKSDPPQNFVEAFVQKMEDSENDTMNIFTDKNFCVIFMDVLQASSDTTSSYLEAAMLFMVLYPDVQAKIYEEIEKYCQHGNDINFSDRKNMIYTQACMLEIHRHNKVVQNLVPRRVLKDFYYKNYLIKKDSVMVADLHTAYNDQTRWKNPFEFHPERFIGENGEIIHQSEVTPFGIGKRKCPGELLANTTAFLFFISILNKYKLSVVPGQKPPREDMQVGFTSKPYDFEVLFSERQ